MSNCYIQINGYKLDIMYGGIDGEWDAEDEIVQTLNNKTYRSIGTRAETWTYLVKVKYTPDAGYAGYAQMRTWRFDQTANGNILPFTDEFGTYRGYVTISDMTKPKPKGKNLDGARAVYTSVIKLRALQ